MKSAVKLAIVVGAGAALFFTLRTPAVIRYLPSNFAKAVNLGRVQMPAIADAVIKNVQPAAYPSDSPSAVTATLIRAEIWEWNAQNGLLLANGGKTTTRGSFMEKYGANLRLERQDDTSKMSDDLAACAKELKDGAKQCSNGANFVVIMGGAAGQFAATANAKLARAGLGPDWNVKVIGAVGRSNGEDALWAPASFKADPRSIAQTEMTDIQGNTLPVKGILAAAVIRDDDWHVGVRYGFDNNIPTNPDEKTFDPDALNWLNSSDYIQAAQDFVAAKCEDRTLVKGGHSTGVKVRVCVNAVATWTPGDVQAATKRGGVVRVSSTQNYLMPAVILGPGRFFRDNNDEIAGMLAAIFQAGDQTRAYDGALKKAAEISAVVYGDEGDQGDKHGSYWYRYARGVTQKDAKGNTVQLGGSAVYGLQDNLNLFGVTPGANDDFRSLYTTFAGIDTALYPDLFKKTPIPAVGDVESKSFLRDAQDRLEGNGPVASAATVDYAAAQSGSVVGDKNYAITFATNSDQPLPDGIGILQQLKDSLAVTRSAISVSGHTDSSGVEPSNKDLSERRAQAVVNYLHNAAPQSFPVSRFQVAGYGSSRPVASNATTDGRAQNRRVEIVLRGGS